jgi:hypothetical protein
MPDLRQGQTVILVRRFIAGHDDYGNDVLGEIRIPVGGCAISPAFSSEEVNGTEQVVVNTAIHMPAGTVVTAIDALIGPDGTEYEVIGTPGSWQSPFTGTLSMVEVKVREVTGGVGVR